MSVDPGRLREHLLEVFVIERDFVIPSGLHGAHAVIFVLEPIAPHPRGDPGHSAILDMQSGTCVGAVCRMILER